MAENSSAIQPTCQSVADLYVNPYYLHHLDGTNLVLVSELLIESNYTPWYLAMMIRLTVKNKVGFIKAL